MTQVIFWDMDGVLLDSLGLDLKVVNPLLEKRYGLGTTVSREFLRDKFALAIPEFIRDILLEVGHFTSQDWEGFVKEYEQLRRFESFLLCPGVKECLIFAKETGFFQWVVSNTREADLATILKRSNIADFFERWWGYDSHPRSGKKPAPDIYLSAFEQAYLRHPDAERFWVFEDSILGIESALAARQLWPQTPVTVVGVATGADDARDLHADRVVRSLESFDFSL